MTEKWQEAAFLLIGSLSESTHTPGGGAAGAVSAAMGCALVEMIAGISAKSKYVPHESKAMLQIALPKIKALKSELMKSISADAEAFDAYMKASKEVNISPRERAKAIQTALAHAAEVPLRTAMLSAEAVLELQKIKQNLSPRIMSDYFAAETLLKAAAECCAEIVRLNLKYMKDRNLAEKIKQQLANCLSSLELYK